MVQVEDEDSRLPVSGVEVYFMQRGSTYLVVTIDPEGRYLTSWSQGSLEELSSSTSSLTTFSSFFPSGPVYAQTLPFILLLVKGVSAVSSLQDLRALLQNPPELDYWGVLYEDRCWTGEQLANYVGAAGLIVPGIDEVGGVLAGGMDEVASAIFLLSQHVIEEDAKDYLSGLDQPVRIRIYHLGPPALGMVPVGWCQPETTPTLLPTPVPPTPMAPLPSVTPPPVSEAGQVWVIPTDGAEMVYVPAGEFIMGSDEPRRRDEQPIHTVYLDAFWIDKTEVTNAQYRACVEAGACSEPQERMTERYNDPDRAKHPVMWVDWNQANAYCQWAGKRLPTEAEWEKACRGTDGRTYPWGEGIDCDHANYSECKVMGGSVPVGSKPKGASPYGALDMAGNVWEWVADWYEAYPGSAYRSPFFGHENKVMRGGDWGNVPRAVRCAIRNYSDPDHAYYGKGFRCAMSSP